MEFNLYFFEWQAFNAYFPFSWGRGRSLSLPKGGSAVFFLFLNKIL